MPGESLRAYIDRVIVGIAVAPPHDPFVVCGPTFLEPSYVFSPYVFCHHDEKLWEPFVRPVF